MAYSNGSGGALTLPSPTHPHHADFGSPAARSLRRSMSRSPSRFNLVGTPASAPGLEGNHTSSTTPPSPGQFGALAATAPPAYLAHSTAPSAPSYLQLQSQISFGTPSKSAVKLSVRSARPKPVATRPLTRTRTSPKSPLKRVFGGVSNAPNLMPASSAPEASGQENANFNEFALGFNSATRRSLEKPSRHSMHLDVSGSSKQPNFSRFLGTSETYPSTTVSPMKRSDATMNLDSTSKGSPVAKRRSLHGISSLSNDFNVFDSAATSTQQSTDAQDENNREYQLTSGSGSIFRGAFEEPTTPTTPGTPTPSSLPRRSASLRKTTLQQRHGDGRSSFGRRAGEKQAALLGNDPATPMAKVRPRVANDLFMVPVDHTSLFSNAVALPNASMHPVRQAQPHPLSQSITQSNSSGSIKESTSSENIEDDLTKIQSSIFAPQKSRAPIFFAKPETRPASLFKSMQAEIPRMHFSQSLPLGARPVNEEDVATPSFKDAKPLQLAFASTGLISKVNRFPENGPPKQLGKPSVMPDTPCKKQPPIYFNTFPPSGSQSGSGGRRNSRAPVENSGTPLRLNTFGKPRGGNIFGTNRSGHTRKASTVSMDGEDNGSPFGDDMPSTPTKTLFPRASAKASAATPKVSHIFAAPVSAIAAGRTYDALNSSPLSRLSSPRTPQEDMVLPDSSELSIRTGRRSLASPATPTTHGRDSFALFGDRRTPQNAHAPKDVDESLMERFGRAEIVGRGEFSDVYRVSEVSISGPSLAVFASTPSRGSPSMSESERIYAVKRIKNRVTREAKLREVNTMKALAGHDRIVQYRDSWWHGDLLYIQTDYYEEGNLAEFLMKSGNLCRLDDFRIWKILVDLAEGVQAIHDAGYMHLDLKPANVMIDSRGYLRICDFGLSHAWPATKSIEAEGDREYISKEILNGQYDKPADIFSLGLIILEIATNSDLPENGPVWRELREGQFNVMMTCPEQLDQPRDVNGDPIHADAEKDGAFGGPSSFDDDVLSNIKFDRAVSPFTLSSKGMTHDPKNLFGNREDGYLKSAPSFMSESEDEGSLDKIVSQMCDPEPSARPTAQKILAFAPVQWVSQRRKAGAVVYEGNFGPKSEAANENDTEMMDV